ncbi:MAG: AIR carboxylase family protein [Bacteroidia bacterium]
MSRTEVVLMYETAAESAALEAARESLQQMGISFREEDLPSVMGLGALRQLLERIGSSACVWAAGRSAYLLPLVVASGSLAYPLIIIPCPSEAMPSSALDPLLDLLRGYPVAFTRPWDAQGAILLAVHVLAARHPSYADLLSAFLQKRALQLS